MQQQIIEMLAMVFDMPESQLTAESSLMNVEQWDSMNHMKLILILEEEFSCKISDDDAVELLSVVDICNYFSR
jgi:acyl carrier protein